MALAAGSWALLLLPMWLSAQATNPLNQLNNPLQWPTGSISGVGAQSPNYPIGISGGGGAYNPRGRTQQQFGLPYNTDRGVPSPTVTPRADLPTDKITEFQQLVQVSTGQLLPIYGSSLFRQPPSTFAPVDDVPVTPDYVIGPGDELRIQMWGQNNQDGSFYVDRTGSISIPQVGTVHVAGVRFADITTFLKTRLSRVYRNFDLNVNLGELRSIQIFVVGQARLPGSYTVGSLSTLINALFASGGPTPQGSLRDIQLRRGNETIVHFDLYDLLLRGDKSNDVPLLGGDVIFIPPVGPQVALAGSVNNPAIYELRGETTTPRQLLELSGGLSVAAASSSVRVERIVDRVARTVDTLNVTEASGKPLANGDIVVVDALADRFHDAVTLRGNVANPGRYRWHEGMRVTDLLPNRDALITRNYWIKRAQLGQPELDYLPAQPAAAPANPASASTGATATGTGSSTTGSTLTTSTAPATAATTTAAPGGITQPGTGVITNTQSGTPPARTGSSSSSGGGGAVAVAALAGSESAFPARNDVALTAPDIDWSYAVVERQDPDTLRTSLVPFNLGRAVLDGDSTQNPVLQPNDVVTIFSTADIRVPSSQQTRFVRLEGEFASAGVYSVAPGETLRQLVARAGGFTTDAYLYASEFTRQSTRRVEQQRLTDYANQLEAQVSAYTSGAAARAISDRDAAAAEASAAEARAAVTRLRQLQPIGRIVLQLKPDSRGIEAVPDLPLEDGDRFVVPKVPSNVYVEGEVYSANAFVFERDRTTARYLRLAGGPNRQADKKRSFVLRADGSVFSRQYGNLEHARIFPGDTIVVPPVVSKTAILRNLVDFSTILSGFGVGVAAINLLR